MKIVGLDGKGSFLVNMSTEELEFLTDFKNPCYGTAAYTDGGGQNRIVGRIFSIKKAWEKLCQLNSHRHEMDKAITILKGVIPILEPLSSIVTEPSDEASPRSA